ncbi:MAG: glucose-6-phosphate isomerase [Coriobacteriia bacterium]|nr:glucose-6-phosphate isomerase [Coriobacteriia bacterium]
MDALQHLIELDAVARLRTHDATLFGTDPKSLALTAGSLGWTTLAEEAPSLLPELSRLASELSEEGCTDVVLLGMGGSSLTALVLGEVLGASGKRTLHVLDTTAPLSVDRIIADLDPAKTLYLVASKSGGTIEPMSLYAIFRDEADNELGREAAGRRFLALTDPGTSLETLAREAGFRGVINTPPTVGGRFSALSAFGLAPAALVGIDVAELITRARAMEQACALLAEHNPAVALAAFIADAHAHSRDKLTIVTSPDLASFGLWVEQLVAESLGKEGIGVVPVVELSDDMPLGYGPDRAVVVVRLAGDSLLPSWRDLLADSAPVYDLALSDLHDVATQFVLWEHAVALTGALLGVNPLGQPDVASAKAATAAVLAGTLEAPTAQTVTPEGVALTFAGTLASPGAPGHTDTLATALGHAIAALQRNDYFALLAYLPEDVSLLAPLTAAVPRVSAALGVAITLELGPRYLHSTGQLHKGGPNSGVFVLLTTRDSADALVPGSPWGLRTLHRAQAEGDLMTLAAAGRRVLHVDLPDVGEDSVAGFAHALTDAAGVTWER